VATGDLYELKVISIANGQNLLNVFHYLQTAGAGGAPQLVPTFQLQVWTDVNLMLHPSTQRVSTIAYDMVDPTDFFVSGTIAIGAFAAGDAMPNQDALSFTYVVNRLDARSGGKRFGLYGEGCQNAGAMVGGMVVRIADAELALQSNISDVSLNTWRPVVYGKRTGGGSTYFSNPISSVRFFGFTTQNNRKFYTSPGV